MDLTMMGRGAAIAVGVVLAACQQAPSASGPEAGPTARAAFPSGPVALFEQTCLAALPDIATAEDRFVEIGMTPRGTEFVSPSGNLVGALSTNRRGCVVTETDRAAESYSVREQAAFVDALRTADPNARHMGSAGYSPLAVGNSFFVPFLKSEGTIAGGDARLIHGILRAR